MKKFIIMELSEACPGSKQEEKWEKYVSSFKSNWMESIELADAVTKALV